MGQVWYKNDTLKVISTSRTRIRSLEAISVYFLISNLNPSALPQFCRSEFKGYGRIMPISQQESDALEIGGYAIV